MDILDRIQEGEFTSQVKDTRSVEFLRDRARLQMVVFREALAKEFNMVGHPKEPLLFEIVWEYSHTYEDCLNISVLYYEKLLGLMR